MLWFYHFIKNKLYQHIIRPIIESCSPINQVALGTLVGFLVGLTPTVGIQMWMVFMIWLFFKYILRIKFDLIIGTALVWISNPLTMFFMYYGFLITGYHFFSLIGHNDMVLSFSEFKTELSFITNNPSSGYLDTMINGSKFLLLDLGYPMVIGSLFYAIPISIISFFITKKYLYKYRLRQAEKMGISYENWRVKFETR